MVPLPNEWKPGDFVHCLFRDNQTKLPVEDFGTVDRRIGDYYVIHMLSGSWGTVHFESIRMAGRG